MISTNNMSPDPPWPLRCYFMSHIVRGPRMKRTSFENCRKLDGRKEGIGDRFASTCLLIAAHPYAVTCRGSIHMGELYVHQPLTSPYVIFLH